MADQSVHPSIPPSEATVEFELNGKTVSAKKGESIIQVAAREGVHVPHYCWHPSLSVAGNCRLCLVEMHTPDAKNPGQRIKSPKPVIGCQTTVMAGSAVFTESPLAKDCQNGMMEFLLVNHPLDCPICDRGGECQLQRYSMEYGQGHTRMVDRKRKFRKPQADPLIDIERNRCIMCTRCVRFCDEVGGEHVMGVFDRGAGNYIGTFGQGPVSNIFSGNVIDLCPVGCLTSKPFRFRARVWELTQTQSTGIWDASGPKVTHWTRNGRLYRTTPPSRKYHETYTVNEDTEEFIDNLTRFGSDFSKHASRWDESRVRLGSSLLPTGFPDAIRAAAAGLADVKVEHGAQSIAVLVSPRATMEEGYLAGKLGRLVIGTDSIDWRSSFRSAAHAGAADFAFGAADGDLEQPFDALFLVNGDFQHTVPTLALRMKEHARVLGLPVVQFGHHHDRYFAAATTMSFHTQPGETTKALRLLWQLLASTGDTAVRARELAEMTGTTSRDVMALVDMLKAAKRGLMVQSLDECNGQFLPEEVRAATAVRQALTENWKYLPTTRDRNAVGLKLVGAQPGSVPGEEGAVARAWRTNHIQMADGISAPELLEAIEDGRIKALLCIGADALANYGDNDRVLAALGKLRFFALSDLFDSPFAQKATVFFGAASNLERNGTYADIQGNLARLTAAEVPIGGAHADWETLCAIGRAMGAENGFRYASVEEVFNEMIRLLAPNFAGSFAGLELAGPENDVSISDPGGARRLTPEYNPGDFRRDGAHFRFTREELIAPESINAESHDFGDGDGLILTFGAHVLGADYHLDHASIANILRVQPYVELHPKDASALGVEENQLVGITLADGTTWQAAARVTPHGPAPGCAYVPVAAVGYDLRNQELVSRVTVEPLAARGAEQALVPAGMI